MRSIAPIIALTSVLLWSAVTYNRTTTDPDLLNDELVLATQHGDLRKLAKAADAGLGPDQLYGQATLLMHSSLAGNVPAVRLLLDRGADVNLVAPSGMTALMAAVTCRRTDVIRTLLDAGADPTLRNRHGRTALDLARDMDEPEIERLLAERFPAPIATTHE